MPLFLKTQMEKTPSCFVIDSDEGTDSESVLSSENNGNSYTLKDLCENLLDADEPVCVDSGTTRGSTNDIQNSSEDDNNLAVNRPTSTQGDQGHGMDDFEFDFQSIDEAEQTEHILKVRVHANFCMRCGTGFVQQKKLNIHLEKNECSANNHSSEMPLTCSICGRGFFAANCLRQHVMLHAQTKPFKCKKCSRSFVTQRDLYSHYRTHKGYRPFICDLCPKTYLSAKQLAVHRRYHAGERPYFCRLCPKRFNKSRNLMDHKRKHASKKPFKCKFCRRSYAKNSVRNIHMRTHTTSKSGQLSFLCEVCGLTHVRFNTTWIKMAREAERRQSDDSIICIGEDNSQAIRKKQWRPLPIVRRRQSSESSDSVQIVEDPLQFTIDLVDE